jgi:hypothetical protein
MRFPLKSAIGPFDKFYCLSHRYSQNDYKIFRSAPLHEVAFGFAERGKTGALALLFKRHTYSLAPYILQLLDAIPEALPPRTYNQLLPDSSPPKLVLPRSSEDWVEKEETLKGLKAGKKVLFQAEDVDLKESTEYMVKLSKGLVWPTRDKIVNWYKSRSDEIDKCTGLLENCLSLLDFGVLKGFRELEALFEDVSDLHGLVFSNDSVDSEVDLRLAVWETLSKYEKFKIILNGTNEETALDRFRDQAIPFMVKNEALVKAQSADNHAESFLIRWLKEKAKDNELQICSVILAECCREQRYSSLFGSDEELAKVVLFCIYASSRTDEWSLMSSMLARLPGREVKSKEPSAVVGEVPGPRGLRTGFMKAFRGAVRGKAGDMQIEPPGGHVEESPHAEVQVSTLSEAVEWHLREAEGHVEAGQLLQQYQVSLFLVGLFPFFSTAVLSCIAFSKFCGV